MALALVGASPLLPGRDLHISVGRLPLYAESKDSGILIDVLKAMDQEYTEGRFLIEVYPLERSIDNVARGKADVHFPTIGKHVWSQEEDAYEKALGQRGLRRSTCSLTKTHFAIYRNRGQAALDTDDLEQYRIETDAGHQIFFDESMRGSTCLPCSVRKLSARRIDGLVFASREIDFMIQDLGIDNIVRQDFRVFGSKFILPATAAGEQTDRLLCELIARMIRNGRLEQVAQPYSEYFEAEYGEPYLPDLDDLGR